MNYLRIGNALYNIDHITSIKLRENVIYIYTKDGKTDCITDFIFKPKKALKFYEDIVRQL